MSFSKIAAVLAILASVCFVALLTLQALEMRHYSAPPSLWPTAAR